MGALYNGDICFTTATIKVIKTNLVMWFMTDTIYNHYKVSRLHYGSKLRIICIGIIIRLFFSVNYNTGNEMSVPLFKNAFILCILNKCI